ncbi:hypothetical protein HOLleu_35963 [Holothuria leucospilota]|uniref:Uncharacterized protein n=1 Tax=Holothuria leucospilota TaxID=206669 RepID=A0A9Q0YNK9_HOLLE|nr:hypothetical protein HOLleu_35963 [Holothuria leucospilota]
MSLQPAVRTKPTSKMTRPSPVQLIVGQSRQTSNIQQLLLTHQSTDQLRQTLPVKQLVDRK